MSITELRINHFRNITEASFEFSPGFNLFFGQNGSGKTSLLESIYFLGRGKSFRSSLANRVIQHDQEKLSLFAKLQDDKVITPAGMMRSRSGEKQMKLNGENIQSLSALAAALPTQLISTESHRFFSDGPKNRRQFLDWGLFHVEQSFYPIWKKVEHALKQRNACLKARLPQGEIQLWDRELIEGAEILDSLRKSYIEALEQIVPSMLETLIGPNHIKARYKRGWNKDNNLQELLEQGIHRDLQLGYTQYGPHRADYQLFTGSPAVPAVDVLSQGQQKLASYALLLAQGKLMQQLTGKSPVYLIDDLPSELDPERRAAITGVLQEIDAQVFITGITQSDLQNLLAIGGSRVFHVKHGVFSEVVEVG